MDNKPDTPVTEKVFINGVTLTKANGEKLEVPPGVLHGDVHVIEVNGELWTRKLGFAMSRPDAWRNIKEREIMRFE